MIAHVLQHGQRLRVGPVHVLQHDDAALRGHRPQQPQQGLAEQRTRRWLAAQRCPLGHEPAQHRRVRAEHLTVGQWRGPGQRHRGLGQRAQGRWQFTLDAPADDRRGVPCRRDDLADQPGLADARLPGDEHGAPLAAAHGLQRGGEHRQLGGPPRAPDSERARRPPLHRRRAILSPSQDHRFGAPSGQIRPDPHPNGDLGVDGVRGVPAPSAAGPAAGAGPPRPP